MVTIRQSRELQPYVEKAAAVFSRRSGLEEDEARQEIWLGILETSQKRGPEFLSQKACYIVQGGVFWARNEWSKRHRKASREVPDQEGLHQASDRPLFDQLVSQEHVAAVMAHLSGDRIAKALVVGVLRGEKKKTIARRAGVSPQSISSARRRVESAIGDL